MTKRFEVKKWFWIHCKFTVTIKDLFSDFNLQQERGRKMIGTANCWAKKVKKTYVSLSHIYFNNFCLNTQQAPKGWRT